MKPDPQSPQASQEAPYTGIFDQVICRLQQSGALELYQKPHGCPHAGLEKFTHYEATSWKPEIGGLVRFKGDVPYSLQTREIFASQFEEETPNARDAALKVHSLRDALKGYLPEDIFAEYLKNFVENIDQPAKRRYYSNALESMVRFIRQSNFSITPEALTHYLGATQPSPILRQIIAENNDLTTLKDYPELVTTIALFQAAHASYIAGLRSELTTTTRLNEEERRIALSVANGRDFDQLSEFVIFPFFMPLVLYAYEHPELAQQAHKNAAPPNIRTATATLEKSYVPSINHERMKEAIGTAWDIFFDKQLLLAHFKTDNAPGAKEVHVLCPANQHFMHTHSNEVLEHIYDKTLEPNRAMTTLIADASSAAEHATAKAPTHSRR